MSPSSNRIRWTNQSLAHPSASPTPDEPLTTAARADRQPHPPTPLLDELGRDLTAQAQEGRLKSLFGRRKELLHLQRILLRKEKNNPLLVGAPGVGKTALVEGLATRAVNGETPPDLQGLRIVEISTSALVAGTVLRGSFEGRLQALIEEARQDSRLVLFIDEIHTLVRAGAVEGGALDAANILKPALARGEIRCIGATTPDEYDRFLHSDMAFQRRFAPLLLEEPGEGEVIEILEAARPTYETHHHVHILPEAIEAAVHLSAQHIQERRLPDKAFDLLDDACALTRLPDPQGAPAPEQQLVVNAEVVASALAEKLGIPVQKLSLETRQRLAGLEEFLNQHVLGQPYAMARIASALRNAFAGLGKADQPRVVLAFFGSSGVGKTATAKALAKFLFESPDAMIRLDMSEFKEAHAVARLFGSPPGYVGYVDEGTFASHLRRQPFSIVLLDEIEKAHPEVHDAFLQIFDEGRFTDARGRLVEARHAIFILTSNLFTLQEINSPEEYDQHAAAIRQSLGGIFQPEFVNRLNEIVLFGELKAPDLAKIAGLEINSLNQRLARYQVAVRASQEALLWIARQSEDPNSGARAVLRMVSRLVAEPLSNQLVSGQISAGQIFDLEIIDNCLHLQKI